MPQVEEHFLADVFKTAGTPTITYVEPHFLNLIRVNLAKYSTTLVVEGPSGIGKTTAVRATIADLQRRELNREFLKHEVQWIRGTDEPAVKRILTTPLGEFRGITVIDDFHRIYPADRRSEFADRLKDFSDAQNDQAKFVVIGVRRANRYLLQHRPDIRLDVVPALGASSDDISKMIGIGEHALNIRIAENLRGDIIRSARGSFQLAQTMCFHACVMSGLVDTHKGPKPLEVTHEFPVLRKYVIGAFDDHFKRDFRRFAKGQQGRFTFKAPYLRLLEWVRDYGPWDIDLTQALAKHPEVAKNVRDLVQRETFREFCVSIPTIRDHIFFDAVSMEAFIENPAVAFYLGEHSPAEFRKKMGLDFEISARPYQVAISYAAEDRSTANSLNAELKKRDVETFFDADTIDGLIGQPLIDRIQSIYGRDADIVVPVIGKNYREKFWTHLEQRAWKPLIEQGRVYPIFVGSSAGEFGAKIPGIVVPEGAHADAWVDRAGDQIIALISKVHQN